MQQRKCENKTTNIKIAFHNIPVVDGFARKRQAAVERIVVGIIG